LTALWLSWYSITEFPATWRWCIVNYSMHALVYTYYTVKALKIPVPKVLAIMGITFLLLLQKVVGCGVIILAWYYKGNGRTCAVSNNNLCWCFLVATSQFILFARFSYLKYVVPKVRPVSKKMD